MKNITNWLLMVARIVSLFIGVLFIVICIIPFTLVAILVWTVYAIFTGFRPIFHKEIDDYYEYY